MSGKWTPGPWFTEPREDIDLYAFEVRAPDGGDVPWWIASIHVLPPDQHEVNARLIAAAPEMAAALEKAAAQFEFYEQSHRAKGTQDGDAKAETNRAMAAEIHAILARIKGAS